MLPVALHGGPGDVTGGRQALVGAVAGGLLVGDERPFAALGALAAGDRDDLTLVVNRVARQRWSGLGGGGERLRVRLPDREGSEPALVGGHGLPAPVHVRPSVPRKRRRGVACARPAASFPAGPEVGPSCSPGPIAEVFERLATQLVVTGS